MKLTNAVVSAALLLLVSAGVRQVQANPYGGLHYSSVDVRVWVEGDYDVFPCEDEVTVVVRASRDCYVTVFLVDTDGFVHVLFPLEPEAEAFLRAGVAFRIHLDGDVFYSIYPRGIAYVFAVGSPWPFVYERYGWGIFPGGFAYRIYGDPFLACREFYLSLLPYRWVTGYVGVSFTYFYVREWVLYPRYLFLGGFGWDRGELCRRYRRHLADPYRVLRPAVKVRAGYGKVVKARTREIRRRSRDRHRYSNGLGAVVRKARGSGRFESRSLHRERMVLRKSGGERSRASYKKGMMVMKGGSREKAVRSRTKLGKGRKGGRVAVKVSKKKFARGGGKTARR